MDGDYIVKAAIMHIDLNFILKGKVMGVAI